MWMVSEKTATTEKLNNYELIIILKPDLVNEKLDGVLENIKKFISNRGGTIADVQKWGKRRLAYPIKNFGEGIYFLLKLRAKANQNRELETNLRISEDVLRHLIVKIE
jgi:small subunit ribosomal protein S6